MALVLWGGDPDTDVNAAEQRVALIWNDGNFEKYGALAIDFLGLVFDGCDCVLVDSDSNALFVAKHDFFLSLT